MQFPVMDMMQLFNGPAGIPGGQVTSVPGTVPLETGGFAALLSNGMQPVQATGTAAASRGMPLNPAKGITDPLMQVKALMRSMDGKGAANITLTHAGKKAIEDWLTELGLDTDTIEIIVAGLTAGSGEPVTLSVDDWMRRLDQIRENLGWEVAIPDVMDPLASVPMIQGILELLGLDAETVDSLLFETVEPDTGINITRLAGKLAALLASDKSTALKPASGGAQVQVNRLMDALGWVEKRQSLLESAAPVLSLEGLVSILESQLDKAADMALTDRDTPSSLAALMRAGTAKKSATHAWTKLVDALDAASNVPETAAEDPASLIRQHIVNPVQAVSTPAAGTAGNLIQADGNPGVKKGNPGTCPGSAEKPDRKVKNTSTGSGQISADTSGDEAAPDQRVSSDPMLSAKKEGVETRAAGHGVPSAKADTDSPFVRQAMADASAETLSEGDARIDASVNSRAAARQAPVKPVPAYVLNQTSRQIARAAMRGETEIRLQLKPAELGRLYMTIDQGNEGVRVAILAENPHARDMLAAHQVELRSALQEHGVRFDRIQVAFTSNFDQSMADARQQQGQTGGRKHRQEKNADTEMGITAVDPAAEIATAKNRRTASGLNLVA